MSNAGSDILQELCRLGRAGATGMGRPVKFLAVVNGKTYEKDLCLRSMDMPMFMLRRMVEMQLPDLPNDGSMTYSLSYIPDERIAYTIFQRRRDGKEEDSSAEDAAVLGCCLMCHKKVGLRTCSRCKYVSYCGKDHQLEHWKGAGNRYGRGSEWAHKKSCPKMAGRPLRLDLDDLPDDTKLTTIEADMTYGFILVKRVHKET